MDLDPKSLAKLSKEELIEKLLKCKVKSGPGGAPAGHDSSRRENLLVMRLTTKEQEVQEYLGQLEELRTNVGGGLRSALLDPVVNSLFSKMKEELEQTKERLDESQQELNAWKFTADSSTGKKLMAKCRGLIQENEELGRMIDTGRLARLEGEVAQSTDAFDQLKLGQSENDDLLTDLDATSEGMQVTIVYLQEQLNEMRAENRELRTLLGLRPDQPLPRSTARAGALRNDFDLDAAPPAEASGLAPDVAETEGRMRASLSPRSPVVNGCEEAEGVNGHSPPAVKIARLDDMDEMDRTDFTPTSPTHNDTSTLGKKRTARNYRKDRTSEDEERHNIFEKLAVVKQEQTNGILIDNQAQ